MIAVFVCAVSSCSQSKVAVNNNEPLKRQWMLKTVKNVSNDLVLKSKGYINFTDLTKAGAKAGCNQIFFTTNIGSNEAISFSKMGATKMYCEEFMKVENAFISALSKVEKYEVKGHFLTLKDKAGNVLIETVAADWD